MLPLRDENPTQRKPVLTVVLILLNVGVYFLVQPQGQQLLGRVPTGDMGSETARFTFEVAAIPCEVVNGRPLSAEELPRGASTDDCRSDSDSPAVFPDKSVWLAVLFSLFLHGSLLHLGGNMLFLWVFGNNIEDHLGPVRFLAFYLAAGVVATGAHIAVQPDSTIPLIGASGAVAGVMGAYLVWFPRAPILALVLIFPVTIRAGWLLGFWLLSQFFVNPNGGVAWMAHVGGFVFGVVVGLAVRANRSFRHVAWRDDRTSSPDESWGRRGRGRY